MMKRIRNLGAGLLALAALAGALPAYAQAQGVTVIGNRLRYEMDQWIAFDDLKASARASLEYLGYGELMYSQNDPNVFTADNDARCPNFARTKLGGQTVSNSSDAQKAAKAAEVIAMFKGHPSQGGLGYAMPARSGIPAQPSGFASLVAGMPRDSNGFYLMTLIYQDGSSATFKLIVPGGSGGDKNNASLVTSNPIHTLKTPTQTAPGQENKAACPW
jgi:hypothetical protein